MIEWVLIGVVVLLGTLCVSAIWSGDSERRQGKR